MKLEEIARRSIEIIKDSGNQGVSTAQLAKELKVPKRRIYDVKAIMKAADLIKTSRDRHGTKIFWKESHQNGKQQSVINSTKIRVSTSGLIKNVANKTTEVIIETTDPSMAIEALN